MKKTISIILLLTLILSFSSCLFSENVEPIHVGTLAGPTGMGMAKMIVDEKDSTKYEFTVYQDPQKATADLSSGELDILCLPTNTAAALFNKTSDLLSVAAINCLGSLYVLAKNGCVVNSVEDLSGQTVYTSVPNSTTKPILQTILDENAVTANIVIESDHDALVMKVLQNQVDYAVLPEPKVSAVLEKSTNFSVVLDLSEEWNKVSTGTLTMGCLVVSNKLIKTNKKAVDAFLAEYKNSIEFIKATNNLEIASQYIVDAGILPKISIARSSLERLSPSLVYVDKEKMKTDLTSFYSVLLETMPTSIGGKLPSDSFYYLGE